MPFTHRRTKAERAADLAEMARLTLRGVPVTTLAKKYGISYTQACNDLAEIRAEWRLKHADDITNARDQELERIDDLMRVYWEEWEKSKEERTITATKRVQPSNVNLAGRTEASVRKEIREGNASYLDGIRWCIERRCKLLGIDAPEKVDTKGQLEIIVTDARAILEARFERMAERLARPTAVPQLPTHAGA